MSLLARAALVLFLVWFCAGPAQATESESWAYGLWGELMSPYCPGRTLADCPSGQAEQLRIWILVQAASGRSRDDVVAELLERFGDDIRPTPSAEGFGLTAYLIPAAAFAVGGVVVFAFLRRQTRDAALRPQTAPEALDPELERAIDEEFSGSR